MESENKSKQYREKRRKCETTEASGRKMQVKKKIITKFSHLKEMLLHNAHRMILQ